MPPTKIKILMIEDDTTLIDMYQNYFTLKDMPLTIATRGNEGLAQAAALLPDLIFLDMMMPEMNGLEVLDKLKADPKTAAIPVVILSNLSGGEEATAALRQGAVKYVIKSDVELPDLYSMALSLPGRAKDSAV